jgi:hypothetical protein
MQPERGRILYMKKLLVGLIVLAALLSVPMAVSAAGTADTNTTTITAQVADEIVVTVTGTLDMQTLSVGSHDFNAGSTPASTVNVNVVSTNSYGLDAAGDGHAADPAYYLTQWNTTTSTYGTLFLQNSLLMKTRTVATFDEIGNWTPSETAATISTDYPIDFRQVVAYGDNTENTYRMVITFTGTTT